MHCVWLLTWSFFKRACMHRCRCRLTWILLAIRVHADIYRSFACRPCIMPPLHHWELDCPGGTSRAFMHCCCGGRCIEV